MKLFLVTLFAIPAFAYAQTVDVKDVDSSDSDSTTIEIRKGKKAEEALKGNKWEVTEGTADVDGEPGATAKDAQKNWKVACDGWKKEFRQDNKENKIINMSCGKSECGGEAGNRTCTSTATYKIKTRVD